MLITDLEIFLRQNREVIMSLKGELIKRHHDKTFDQLNKFNKYCERLYNIIKKLSVKERLNGRTVK